MIKFIPAHYDIFDFLNKPNSAIANPTNTVGVMGAGLAKTYASRFPGLLQSYRKACHSGEHRIGRVHFYPLPDQGEDLYNLGVLNFPTKKHWKDPSKISYIEQSISHMFKTLQHHNINRITLPALGSGLGGLNFNDVRDLLTRHLSDTDDLKVNVICPK